MAKKTQTEENNEEKYARWYFEELQTAGYVKRIDREVETISVLPEFKHKRVKRFVKKDNVEEDFTLLKAVNYTYDFRIIWTDKAINLFTEIFNPQGAFLFGEPFFISHYIKINNVIEIVSYIDVKPHTMAARFGGKLSTFYTFPFIQKFLLHTRGLFINKMIPVNMGKYGINTCMFAQTFTPQRYLFTDKGKDLRKIRFKKNTLNNFISQRENLINEILIKDNHKSQQKGLF